jgi:hypothetical protein
MTPEQRSEKISAFLDENNIVMTDDQWSLFKQEIAAEIRAAVEESMTEYRVQMAAEVKPLLAQAKAASYADAARIAEEEECGEYCCSDPVFKVSTKIRPLASEVAGGKA